MSTIQYQTQTQPYTRIERSLSEHVIQSSLVQIVRCLERKYAPLALLYAIPNGGDRHKVVAGKLKAEGVRRGVPDLHLPVSRGEYHSLYIEMKTCSGRLSAEQRNRRELLVNEGNAYVVCRTLNEGLSVLGMYLNLSSDNKSLPESFFRINTTPIPTWGLHYFGM